MLSIGDIPDLPDPVPLVVREAEWAIHGRCPVTENGVQCRFINTGHAVHFYKPVGKDKIN
jgi:hypothetical protein